MNEKQLKPTLLVLAAGRGSRFGGAKQVTPMGPHGETIMEYSIYDALHNGFGQVVLVINKDVEKDTFELIDKMGDIKNKISYAYQDLWVDMIPKDIQDTRLKPWGTAHAIYSAQNSIQGSFAMINADDFYGQSAFKTMADFLTKHTQPNQYSMVGYDMKNTLSANGTVSRGVSVSDENGHLKSIVETHGIYEENNVIYCEDHSGNKKEVTEGMASMNFWGFQNNLFDEMKAQFQEFLQTTRDLAKDEFQIPTVIDRMIKKEMISVEVLHSTAKWFGVTYKEDTEFACNSIQDQVKQGFYPTPLWK